MCHWYAHVYACKHKSYALGKYCGPGNLLQKPCKQRNIWQTIRMGEDCEGCAGHEDRDETLNAAGGEVRVVYKESEKDGRRRESS
jgi:hypothetical protein